MFIRRKTNRGGSVSIQVVDTSGRKDKLIRTIGSSRDADKVEALYKAAQAFIDHYHLQLAINFTQAEDESFFTSVKKGLKQIEMIGPELILGKLFDAVGFNIIEEDLFRHLVISRLVFPLSKLKTTAYLLQYKSIIIEVDQLYRFLDKLHLKYKDTVQNASYQHTLKILEGNISIVFYDVTTLYFESSDEDDLRKTGFSKEGKHQNPQIVLGLLVSINGYPLAYEIFEGNKFEGHTMLPVIEKFKHKYQLQKLIIVADAGLLSKNNIDELLQKGYEFILGGRIKSEKRELKQKILSYSFTDGESIIMSRDNDTQLIVSYALARSKKDNQNRERGLKKLETALRKGKLSKQHINNRGYNKYLKLEGEIQISIDYNKFNADAQWDGLKGYITNSKIPKEQIIDNYKHLWQIEKAFRISKTDLRIRPIYHRLQRRIEAHICIAFCAYKIFKELERQLKLNKTKISAEKAIDLMKTIYKISVELPKSSNSSSFIFAPNDQQQELLKIFKLNI